MTQLLSGQSRPHYREFELGGDLASVSALADVAVSETQIIHQRPAHMTDVLSPVFIPYARFLKVRARRLDIVTELTQTNGQRADHGRVSSSAAIANNEPARVAVRVIAADSAAGVQHS